MKEGYILYNTKWYPHHEDPQSGIFIRKHAEAASVYRKVVVGFAKGSAMDRLVEHKEGNLYEYSAYYRRSSNPLINAFRAWKNQLLINRKILSVHGLPSMVHVNILSRPAIPALYYQVRYKIPFIVSEHWSGFITNSFQKKNFLRKAAAKVIASRARYILTVSESLSSAMKACGINGNYRHVDNVISSPNTIHVTKGDRKKFIVIADLVDKIKNISGIITAFEIALKQIPGIRLTIAGDGPDRKTLEQIIDKKGLTDQIKFCGRLTNEEVFREIVNSGVLIVNSYIETFSMVTAEAMLCGRPVIATRCGGPERFITPATGLLINPGDHTALARSIITMYEGYDLYNPNEINASIGSRFSTENIGKQLSDIYDEAIAENHKK